MNGPRVFDHPSYDIQNIQLSEKASARLTLFYQSGPSASSNLRRASLSRSSSAALIS
ncbi:uncharacterized protein METZ01_LOCUS330511, partial [marine metagenome]